MNALTRLFSRAPAQKPTPPVIEAVVAEPEPAPIVAPIEVAPIVLSGPVRPFLLSVVTCEVLYEGATYTVQATDIDWLSGGYVTRAKIRISRQNCFSVREYCEVIVGGKKADPTDVFTGAFANAGMTVQREFLHACLLPLIHELLKIEQKLKSF